jgi:Mn2+/Fe2+ NRAMP family transporter
VNGIAAAPLMAMLMLMSANRAVVREFTLPLSLRIIGWAATAVMALASIAFLASMVPGSH